MNKAITKHSIWHNTSECYNYTINSIYIDSEGTPVIFATCNDDIYFGEWELENFYQEFTFVSHTNCI